MKNNKKNFIFQSWWVFLFILTAFVGYKYLTNKKNKEIVDCRIHLAKLEEKKEQLKNLRKKLFLQINSKKDTKWIEMVLMKDLGVVPEGKLKIYFVDKK